MNDSIYYVLWHQQEYYGKRVEMYVSFTLFSSALDYAKILKETYPNAKDIEIAKRIDYVEL